MTFDKVRGKFESTSHIES